MPRTIDATLKTWLDTIPLLESHSTFKVSLPFTENADIFYYATVPVSIGGQAYDRPLKSIGELKLSMGRAADRVEVRLSNEDGLNGGIFIQSRDALRGNRVEIGRYYRNPQSPTTDYHVILFKGTIVSVSVDDRDIVLTVVSDLYAGGMIGAVRVVATSCQFVFKDSATCGYVGAETVCNKRYTDAGGCSGRSNQHRYGGALKRNTQAGLQTSSGGPPAVNQLVKAWDGATATSFIQRSTIAFENATITDDPTNDRTIINPTGAGTVFINLKDSPYSARGDAKFISDAAITSGTPTLTSATASFTAGDVGKKVYVEGAGTAGAMLATTISAYVNSTTVTLAANASTTVSGATALYGTDDTTAIQTALTTAASSDIKTLYLPAGKYLVTGLTLAGEVHLLGDGDRQSVICSGANAAILAFSGNPTTFRGAMVENIKVKGMVGAGASQIGFNVDDPTYAFQFRLRHLTAETCGGNGLFVGKAFSSTFTDIYLDNCAGYPLLYDAQNMPKNRFELIYIGLLRDTAKVGFRIKAGEFFARNCNGVNSLNDDSVYAIVGRKNGVDGDVTNGGAVAYWEHCNFETLTKSHVIHYHSSSSHFRGICTFAAQAAIILQGGGINNSVTTIPVNSTGGFPASGKIQINAETIDYTSKDATNFLGCTRGVDGTSAASHAQYSIVANKQFKPIVYEVDDVTNYPQLVARGYIDDSCSFADGPETNYANNQAIHANALPPLQTIGKGPTVNPANASASLGTWWNSAASKIEVLPRADGMMKRTTITGTTVFSNPGVRLIEVNNTSGAAMDLTLPPAIWYKTQEFIIVKDVAGNAKTHPITVYGGGGAQVEGSSFTMNENKQACIFFPNEADTVNGSWRLAATYPIPSGVKRSGSGLTDYIPIFSADDTITSGPLYRIGGNTIVSKDAIIAETDNTKDLGGDGFNRFRDIFAARKFKAPAFVTPGANGMYGGSADPEGSQTAEPGSIYLRTNGNLYKKTSGSGNTGWTLISTGVGVTGSGLATFFTQFTNDSTIEAAPMYESGGSIISQEPILPETNNSKDLGSAALKWRTGYFGTKLQTVVYEFTNGLTINTGTGSPEGVVTAFAGSLYLDDGGALYRKSSGSGNTGWTLVSNAGLANTALSNLSGVAINAALIADTNNAYDLGSAALKWRTGYFGTKIQTVVFEFTNGLTLTTGSGNPEGVVSAFLGSLYLDDSGGILYRKASGFGNTGWTAVGGANTALSNLASVAINASLIANANNTLDLGSTGTRWRTGYFGTSLVTPLLALESRTDPGSPANGDAWNSSDRNAVSVRIAGQTEDVVTSMWRNSAAASFDTTLTETSLLADTGVGTKTLAANRLKVGNQVRVKLAGLYGTKASSPGNFTIKLKNGATTMVTISAFGLPTNVVDQNWWIEAVGTVTATGGSGNILWTVNFYYNDGTGTVKGRPYTVNSAIIDTTASRLIDVTGQFTVSDIANYWETTTASIELVA